jgi:hypothetical protein
VTLDADVQALLRAAMKKRGMSFKEALNTSIRLGLTQGKALEDEELGRKLSLRK